MRKRFEELQRHLEQQRWRIARDIHDELGAKLTRISYLSEVARCSADTAHGSELEGIGVAARELLRTLAAIVWAMTPRNDTLEHLVEYAGQYASDFFQMTGVDCQVTIPAELPNQPLASQTRHEFLRVIQESLNNILKHAGASRVGLKFEVQEFELSSTITDNGRGFDLDKVDTQRVGGGNGLRIIRERMADLGGGLRIQSAPGQGTTLYLTLPLAKRHAENSRKLAASARAFASATRGCETIAQAHPPV
jgi:signal transduction histidine kinase